MNKGPTTSFLGICVWTVAILFFLYEYFLRVLPATAAKHMISGLDLSFEQFAVIGAGYYITYALMQIPVGILLDRFSTKNLLTGACGLCWIGMMMLSYAESFWLAFIARLLIGLGSSFGYIGLMVVALNWFPRKYFAFLNGLGLFLGCLGPVIAGAPIAHLVEAAPGGWRQVFLWVALFGIALMVVILVVVKGKQRDAALVIYVERDIPIRKQIGSLVKTAQIWWVYIAGAMVYVTVPILGAFWGTTYLTTRGFETTTAAFIVSMMWIGLSVGSLVSGKVSQWMHRRKPICLVTSFLGVIMTLVLLYAPCTGQLTLSIVFFLIGFSAAGMNIGFALTVDIASDSIRATALGLNNTIQMLVAALFPPAVTAITKIFAVNGAIEASSFQRGFAVLPLFFLVSFLVMAFGVRETFCRQQGTVHKI